MNRLVAATAELRDAVAGLPFGPPVACAYRPLDYAWEAHCAFLERYGQPPKRVVLVGLNPGPFGMVQTGVPFGDPTWVRDFLGIEAPVRRPPCEHPKRPVLGFASRRHEGSGCRFWEWVASRFGSPDRFFAEFFILNWCPIAFVDGAGRNLTPDKLAPADRATLYPVCDLGLRSAVTVLRPEFVFGLGRLAWQRCLALFAGEPLRLGTLPHPSPANPAARGWSTEVDAILAGYGLVPPSAGYTQTNPTDHPPP